MSTPVTDQGWITKAIVAARDGWYTTTPNPRVGCVIVKDGQQVGIGAHLKAGQPHAEVHALADAGERAKGATVYVTLEPCCHTGRTGPCAQALIDAGVAKVIIGMRDPNPKVSGRGIAMLEAAGIEVIADVASAECESLNLGFIKRMTAGTPRITIKMAASLDGRTALANGQSQWITSEQARADVHRFRAESCAVLSSAESVIADCAQMTVRPEQFDMSADDFGGLANGGELRQPDRVILDGRCRLTGDEPVFNDPASLVLVLPPGKQAPVDGVRTLHLDYEVTGFDLPALLAALAACEYNDVWVEAGAALAGAFVAEGLVDRLVVYVAPKLMGHHSRGMLGLPLISDMGNVIQMKWQSIDTIGPDLRLIARFSD
ncbi:bifunctional diaminohydroxyphosphoribosylaminopyrimidine deaminase/5-amino-6-(5-phosphoribosylamino)uracil reductase RibD [Neiella marina]|uniref:Riboflavin biosynthesis protein RibD n=1 Tax=Neiella holothuriorum TaxID=2870530 RepID=A0ABS7EMZ3_9GAMM|nr:bifunctional diaminohydroxyphosphoribosylaminopyrimidine deaminase/5-amino-6-(5-phosphoribosylamino)uracil reductase RibD [Neiella holothuriorum]MBW8192956.1 bifunctional diaminohydroxyphosphoribosylaminopyrimidine deaminase/5-amino-6-(5-phosphoribosylamino)uracil reductase RibD [Neiella holothuriorum]